MNKGQNLLLPTKSLSHQNPLFGFYYLSLAVLKSSEVWPKGSLKTPLLDLQYLILKIWIKSPAKKDK